MHISFQSSRFQFDKETFLLLFSLRCKYMDAFDLLLRPPCLSRIVGCVDILSNLRTQIGIPNQFLVIGNIMGFNLWE